MHCCRIVNGIKNKNIKNSLGASCPKDKNRSPFHGEKPLMIKWFLGRRLHQISQKRFCMVGTRYFASASNDWYSVWYCNYGRTWSITSLLGLVFCRRRAVFILGAMPPPSLGRAALVMWFAWNQTCHITNDRCEALASLKGCFLCFCFSPQYFSTEPKSIFTTKNIKYET